MGYKRVICHYLSHYYTLNAVGITHKSLCPSLIKAERVDFFYSAIESRANSHAPLTFSKVNLLKHKPLAMNNQFIF